MLGTSIVNIIHIYLEIVINVNYMIFIVNNLSIGEIPATYTCRVRISCCLSCVKPNTKKTEFLTGHKSTAF